MTSKRDQIIDTTCQLMEIQGYHATGLNQVVADSGAPKGSLYYYFPDGKEELAAEAIGRSGQIVVQRIQSTLGSHTGDAGAALASFVNKIADAVERSGFEAGGPLTAVAMETATTNERLNMACRVAFDQIIAAFAAWLVSEGFSSPRAAELATIITISIEGGTILSRTNHNGEPLRLVARELERCLADTWVG